MRKIDWNADEDELDKQIKQHEAQFREAQVGIAYIRLILHVVSLVLAFTGILFAGIYRFMTG